MEYNTEKVDTYIENIAKNNYRMFTLDSSGMEKYYKKKLARRENAMKKFGYICFDGNEREAIKLLESELTSFGNGIFDDLKILSHWSRSLEASGYSLEHPDFYEYRTNYMKDGVSWLRNGYTIVDMREYKKNQKK